MGNIANLERIISFLQSVKVFLDINTATVSIWLSCAHTKITFICSNTNNFLMCRYDEVWKANHMSIELILDSYSVLLMKESHMHFSTFRSVSLLLIIVKTLNQDQYNFNLSISVSPSTSSSFTGQTSQIRDHGYFTPEQLSQICDKA